MAHWQEFGESDWHTSAAPRRYLHEYYESGGQSYGSFADLGINGKTVTLNVRVEEWSLYEGRASGVVDTLNVYVDGNLWASSTIALDGSWGGQVELGATVAGDTKTLEAGNHTVDIYMCCSDGAACPAGAGDPPGALCYGGMVFSVTEPYTPPSISLNSNKDLGVYNKSNDYWVNYTITAGTNSIVAAGLEIVSTSSITVYRSYTDINRTAGSTRTYNYTLNNAPNHSEIASGSRYRIRLYVQDGTSTIYSAFGNIHTCHDISVGSLKLSPSGSTNAITSFSPKDTTVRFTWTQNNNSNNWVDAGERNSTNRLYTKTSNVEHSLTPGDNDTSLTMTTSNINKLFPTEERNTDKLPKTVTIERHQDQIPDTKTSSVAITLQLQPDKQVGSYKIFDSNGVDKTTTIKGQRVDITNEPNYATITLQWSYPYTEIGAGIISGYNIDICTDAACTQVFKTIPKTTTAYSNVQAILNSATDLAQDKMNYVKITAYYKYSNNSSPWPGANPLIDTIFAPYSGLPAPTIDYPINNSTWHNKNFRVLFRPPVDPGYASLSNAEKAAYRYADVEVNINNTAYKFSEHPEIFNETQLYHVNHRDSSGATSINYIVANPSLVNGFSDTSNYVIKVRVAKTVFSTPTWSAYSTVTLKKSAITDNTYTVGDNITATHFNKIRNYCVQLRNVYPIRSLYPDNVTVSAGTAINHNRYQAIWNNVAGIQQDVNNYAKFDSTRQNVKFNQTIIGLSSTYHNEAISDEVITATKNSVVDRTILLFNGAPWGHTDESKTVGFKVSANLVIKRPTPDSTRVNITGNINIVTTLMLTYTLNDTSGTKGIGAYLNVGGVSVPLTPYTYNILAAPVNSVIWNRNVSLTGNNGVNFTSGNLQVVLNYQFYNPVNQHTTLYTINVGPTVAASAVPYDSTWTPDQAPYDSHGRNYLKIIFDDMQKLY